MTDYLPQYVSETPPDGGLSAALSTDERHRLLAADGRRVALRVLADLPKPASLEEIAASVAERVREDETALSRDASDVAVALHHRHLPMLDSAGVVVYDAASNRVVHCNDVIDDLTP